MTLVKIKDNKVVIEEPKIPALDKQSARSDDIATVKGFLDWLLKEWLPAQRVGSGAWETRLDNLNIPDLINKYFELDETKMERDRRLILMCQRIHNANHDLRKKKKVKDMDEADRELYVHGQLMEVEKEEREELSIRT